MIFSVSFFIMAHMTLTSSYLPPVMASISAIYSTDNETFNQQLPYFSWMPFAYNTPVNFLWAVCYQAGPMFSYAYSIVGMDTLFMNIMNFIVAHLCVIQGAFKTNRARCCLRIKGPELTNDGLWNSKELSREMIGEMKKIINHLQTILG